MKDTACFQRCRNLTINLDLIVLQCLSSLISGHTGISPRILFFSIENLQSSPTCEQGEAWVMNDKIRTILLYSIQFDSVIMYMWSQTWKDPDIATGLKWSAVLEPGDESSRVGLDFTQQRGWAAQSYCHLLRRTIRTWTSNGGRNCQTEEGTAEQTIQEYYLNSSQIFWLILEMILNWLKRDMFVPRTLRLKCRLRSPALLDARQLYLPVSTTWAPEIWRKRPWDKTWLRLSGTNSCPSFSHLISGTGLPGKLLGEVNKVVIYIHYCISNVIYIKDWSRSFLIRRTNDLDVLNYINYLTLHMWE